MAKWLDNLTDGQRFILGMILGAVAVVLAWLVRKGLDFWERG